MYIFLETFSCIHLSFLSVFHQDPSVWVASIFLQLAMPISYKNVVCLPPYVTALGWGLLCQFPPFCYFPHFSALWKHCLPVAYHIHVWQVSLQLSCSDTCQIWMWFEGSNFFKIKNFLEKKRKIFSNLNPSQVCLFIGLRQHYLPFIIFVIYECPKWLNKHHSLTALFFSHLW